MGFEATGGGGLCPIALTGREVAGLESLESDAVATFFFQGVADPFAGIIPGKTATGLAWASAVTDDRGAFGVGRAVEGAEGAAGGLRPAGRGGGAGLLGFAGASSR